MKDFRHLGPSDYFKIPWKRRWYFLVAAILITGAASVYAWLRPVMYRSETKIVVASATLVDETVAPNQMKDRTEERMNAIRQMVESRMFLQRIVEEFNLRFGDTSEETLRSVRNNLEVSRTPSGNVFTIAYYSSDRLTAKLVTERLAGILLDRNQQTQKSRADDKNAFLEGQLQKAEKELEVIDQKIRQFKEKNLVSLPEQSAANMNTLNGLHSQLVALENSLDRARDQQKALQFRLAEQKRLSDLAKSLAPKEKPVVEQPKPKEPPSALEVQLASKRSQLAEITARYTPKHPDVVRLTKEVEDLEQQVNLQKSAQTDGAKSANLTPLSPTESKPAPDSDSQQANAQLTLSAAAEIAQAQYELKALENTIARREGEREELLKKINEYEGRLNLAPKLGQDLLTLTREFETQRQEVANLQAKKFNSQIASDAVKAKGGDLYETLDPASLPEKPVPPTRLQIVLIGIAAGLGAGLAAAFTREYFEPSLSTEEEAAAALRLPVLVSVPEIPAGSKALIASNQ